MSPACRSLDAEFVQTPARQSACSSWRTDSELRWLGSCADTCWTCSEMPEHGLDVVAELVGHDVRHREVAALGAEARLELVEEAEIKIDLLVGRAVERAGRGGCRAARRLRRALEQHELRLGIVSAGGAERLRPECLDAVHDVGELLVGLALGVERAARLDGAAAGRQSAEARDGATPAQHAAEQQEQRRRAR